MKFTIMVDRIGSTVAALVASLIMAGMVALGFQVLPLPTKFLGYDRFPQIKQDAADHNLTNMDAKTGSAKGLFPYADGLVHSLVKNASAHGFAGSSPFGRTHPDFRRELYLNRMLINQESCSRLESSSSVVSLERAWQVTDPVYDSQTNNELLLESTDTLIAVHLKLFGAISNKDIGSWDSDRQIRFVLSNFRLVGYDEQNHTSLERYPQGYYDPERQLLARPGFNQMRVEGGTSQPEIVLLFTWPQNIKSVRPSFTEFKRTARVPMPSPAALVGS